MASPQYPPGTIASQQADGVTPGLQIASPAALAPGNGKNPPIVPNAHGPTATPGVPGDHTYHAPGGSPHDLAGTEPLTAGSLVLQDPVFLQGLQQLVTEAVSGSMQAFSDRSSRSRSRYSSSSSDSGSGDDDHSHYRRHRRHKRSRSPLHRHRDDETHYSPRSRSHSTSRDHRPTSPAASGSQILDDVSLFAPSISEFQEREQEQEGIQGLTPEHKEEEVVTSPPDPYDLLTSMEPRETEDIIRNIEDCEKTERTVDRLNSSGFAVNNPAFLFNKPILPKTQQSSGSHSSGGKHHPRGGLSPRSPPVLQPLTLVAGRLQHFLPQWQAITSDAWVLQAIQGLKPQLTGRPIQRVAPREQNRSAEETDLISREIQSLLQKGA
ncbi:Hypp6889 [Branchiostoma lanceolatum]|uniref:Hypp6889 protein n=1 Tax=Branchiostoma lanceolatum TaxID=7740 RepID=A0A8K0E7Q8_BRALA|nr:Hypp6889 [Branchiostoma lanceolatum]